MKKIKEVGSLNVSQSFSTNIKYYSGIVAAGALLSSCQTYSPKPLDIEASSLQWKKRGVTDEKVTEFAKTLTAKTRLSGTFNPSNGINLNEGQIISLVYNPDLRIARLKANIAKASAEHAGLWNDPEFGLNVHRITEGVPKPWAVASSLSFTIPLSGRIEAKKKQAELQRQVELAHVIEKEWDVTCDLQLAWISWSSTHAKIKQSKKLITLIEDAVNSTDKLTEIGEIAPSKASLLHLELAKHKVDLKGLRGDLESQEQRIRAFMGISPKASLRLVPQVDVSYQAGGDSALKKNSPILKRLRMEYAVSEATLITEIKKQYPDLTIGPSLESDEGQSSIGFIGSIPIPVLNANKGGIASAKAQRELSMAAFETEYERRVGQLAILRSELKTLQSQNRAFRDELLPMVDRQVSEAKKLIDLGEGGILVLLESLGRAHEAKVKVIELYEQRSITATEIQRVLGTAKNH